MARSIFNNIDMDKYSWCNFVFQNIFFKNRSNIFFFFGINFTCLSKIDKGK